MTIIQPYLGVLQQREGTWQLTNSIRQFRLYMSSVWQAAMPHNWSLTPDSSSVNTTNLSVSSISFFNMQAPGRERRSGGKATELRKENTSRDKHLLSVSLEHILPNLQLQLSPLHPFWVTVVISFSFNFNKSNRFPRETQKHYVYASISFSQAYPPLNYSRIFFPSIVFLLFFTLYIF